MSDAREGRAGASRGDNPGVAWRTFWKALIPEIDQTVLEVWTMGGVLAGTFEFSDGAGPKTITNAQLIAALGTENDFKLRAWFVRSGYRSLNYDEVIVTKIGD